MNGPISYSSQIINKNGLSQMDLSFFSPIPSTIIFVFVNFPFFAPFSDAMCVLSPSSHFPPNLSHLSFAYSLLLSRLLSIPLLQLLLFWDCWMFLTFMPFLVVFSFLYFHFFSLFLLSVFFYSIYNFAKIALPT